MSDCERGRSPQSSGHRLLSAFRRQQDAHEFARKYLLLHRQIVVKPSLPEIFAAVLAFEPDYYFALRHRTAYLLTIEQIARSFIDVALMRSRTAIE
jgi:hypothetical protein